MIVGAVLAGGTGTRMGKGAVPKQFLKIGGKEILLWTVENMLRYKGFDKLLVLCPAEWTGQAEALIGSLEDGDLRDRVEVLTGGATRTETLMRAAGRAAELAGADDAVLVTHDAARPFVTERVIAESAEAAAKYGASAVAVPQVDTIFESADGVTVDAVPDRRRLFDAQTPQAFRVSKLIELYGGLSEEEKEILTDGAKIFVTKGEPVGIVIGDTENIKITYPADLITAEAILQSRRGPVPEKGKKE